MVDTDRLMAVLYETVEDPALWQCFLDDFTRQMRAGKGALFEATPWKARMQVTSGYDRSQIDSYVSYFHGVDVWAQAARRQRLPQGEPRASQDLCPDSDLERTEFYHGYLAPHGDYHGCGLHLHRPDDQMIVLNLIRDRRAGAFGEPDLGLFARLAPHLCRVMALSETLRGVEARTAVLQSALDHLRHPMFILAADRRVAEQNAEAERYLSDDGCLRLRDAVLRPRFPAEDRTFQALIGEVVATASATGHHPGGSMILHDGDRLPHCFLTVWPLRRMSVVPGLMEARALVVVTPARRRASHQSLSPRLQAMYGLTPMEARLLAAVAEGESLEAIGRALNIKLSTVRSYLKTVYQKMACSSRAQLMSKVLSCSAWWLR